MNTGPLDARLRNLASSPGTGTPASTIRRRAGRRRTRRRAVLAVAAIPVLALVATAVLGLDHTDPTTELTTGPASNTEPGAPGTIGELEGVTVTASPNRELIDGDQVKVRIRGLERLQRPILVLCAADVTADNALERCDLTSLDRAGAEPGDPSIEADMTVTIRNTISLYGADEDSPMNPYDCTAAPGCVIAVGQQTPAIQGAYAPLHFAPNQPRRNPMVTVEPATDLQDRQPVTVSGEGLRPSSLYSLQQCTIGEPRACDELAYPTVRTDADGAFRTETPALAALYGWRGRVDCTESACQLVVHENYNLTIAETSITYADDVVTDEPRLEVTPAGPHRDQQPVTVAGRGFPPGTDVGGHIGQCPDEKDTAVEERCSYSVINRTIVGEDGSFEMELRIQASLLNLSCTDETGCHLGWVLNHGPTIAKFPLDIES